MFGSFDVGYSGGLPASNETNVRMDPAALRTVLAADWQDVPLTPLDTCNAAVPETEGMLQKEHFARMRDGAVFINTGRGRTVREDDLCDVLEARPDLTALLDVTYPEPPSPDSRLYTLPNALVSTHIAGSINSEVARLGEIACAEFLSWKHGKPMRFAISLEKLSTMA